MNTVNVARGVALRRALLEIARLCQERGVPLPTVREIASAAGICPEQMRRHFRRLITDGVIEVGIRRKRRHVREIRQ